MSLNFKILRVWIELLYSQGDASLIYDLLMSQIQLALHQYADTITGSGDLNDFQLPLYREEVSQLMKFSPKSIDSLDNTILWLSFAQWTVRKNASQDVKMFILFLITALSPFWCSPGSRMSYVARTNVLGAFVHPKSVTQPSAQVCAVQICLAEQMQSPELRYLRGQIQAERQQVHLGGCGQEEVDSVICRKMVTPVFNLAPLIFLIDWWQPECRANI